MPVNKLTRRGDTMIEVMFGVAIFGLISVATITLMNQGLGTSESTLESTMARNEMDAQAEALRFIHSSYASTTSAYKDVWKTIVSKAATNADAVKNAAVDGSVPCSEFYKRGGLAKSNSFVINTNRISPLRANTLIEESKLFATTTYPMLASGNAYGIWINVVKGKQTGSVPYYYDFYIRSCWYGVGSTAPSTLDTVVRLYNPDRTG